MDKGAGAGPSGQDETAFPKARDESSSEEPVISAKSTQPEAPPAGQGALGSLIVGNQLNIAASPAAAPGPLPDEVYYGILALEKKMGWDTIEGLRDLNVQNLKNRGAWDHLTEEQKMRARLGLRPNEPLPDVKNQPPM